MPPRPCLHGRRPLDERPAPLERTRPNRNWLTRLPLSFGKLCLPLTALAQNITPLINEGVLFSNQSLQYFFDKLANLRSKLLAQTTKDALKRATAIVASTGGRVGPVVSVTSEPFQITPVESTEVSNSGSYDTTTIVKKLTAIVVFDSDSPERPRFPPIWARPAHQTQGQSLGNSGHPWSLCPRMGSWKAAVMFCRKWVKLSVVVEGSARPHATSTPPSLSGPLPDARPRRAASRPRRVEEDHPPSG